MTTSNRDPSANQSLQRTAAMREPSAQLVIRQAVMQPLVTAEAPLKSGPLPKRTLGFAVGAVLVSCTTALRAENDAALGAALAPGLTALLAGAVLALLSLGIALALAFRAFRSRKGVAIALALNTLYLAWVANAWSLIARGVRHVPFWPIFAALVLLAFALLAPLFQHRTQTRMTRAGND